MASIVDQLPQKVPADSRKTIPWVTLGWFAVLLIAAYFPTLKHLVEQWMTDEDVGHGFFVLPVALFIAWQRRDRLLQIPQKPSWTGAVLLVWAAAQSILGTLAAEQFLQRSAFLISIVGLLLLLGGFRLVKELAFPLLLLPFMIPLPTVIYNQITFPLQLFASQVAESALGFLGIPVLRDGNILELASQKLSVAEACSGIRSLLSLTFLSLVYGYFFDSKTWMRLALLVGTIPIAIIANAGRVTITGILSEINPELAHGFFHSLEGWIIFLIAFAMLGVLHWVINFFYRLFTPSPDDEVADA